MTSHPAAPPSASPAPTPAGAAPGDACPCVIDIEASGFGSASYPVEIGIVLPDGSSWCTLVSREPDWTHWDGEAERLHGITRELLLRHGRPVPVVAAELNRHLEDRRVYSDNWAHDFAWLATLFERAGIERRFALHHLNELMDEAAMARFDAERERVSGTLELKRHRASSDAKLLQASVMRAMDGGVGTS
jgi:hypothetical protein